MVKRILVTRAKHQSQHLTDLIESNDGWHAIIFPVMDVLPVSLSADDSDRLACINCFDYVFFISVNAVNFALKLFSGKIEKLQGLNCVAVGRATYNCLVSYGLSNILVSKQGFNSESLLVMPELRDLQGYRCLIIRGKGGRELLADSLLERGATVDYLETYERVLAENDNITEVEQLCLQNEIARIVIYSGEALRNLLRLLNKEIIKDKLLSIPLVVISQRVYELAKEMGFKSIIIAEEASDSAMVNALLNGEECG